MATATEQAPANPLALAIEPKLVKAVVDGVSGALGMCGVDAKCVGMSSVPDAESGLVTGLIGVHGSVSGFITVNLSERMALEVAGGLLQDSFSKLSSQVVDAAGELTNIIVGGIKSGLAGSPWAFLTITVPSVIVGRGYNMTYAHGLEFVCVTFEHADKEAIMLDDRLMRVCLSLLRL